LAVAADGGFTCGAALTEGSAYTVTVKTQLDLPKQIRLASGASGTVRDAAVTSITIAPPLLTQVRIRGERYRAFSIQASSGALTPVSGSPFTVGAGPQQIIVSR
jgi:hypothetical protein